ncbi:Dps family protein [Flavitalea sp.]|nr:DNA starvation/stationary phase protection protein [Flavitalea sp.]
MINQIGIEETKSKELANKLNLLLSDLQLFYINARGFHWNIKGNKFFELHLKFEELYTDALTKVDEVAERILTLGNKPLHSFSDYLKNATIKEITDIFDGNKAIEAVLDGFRILLDGERELLHLSSEANDEGTNALMSDYIREQEKSVWMYSAYLK